MADRQRAEQAAHEHVELLARAQTWQILRVSALYCLPVLAMIVRVVKRVAHVAPGFVKYLPSFAGRFDGRREAIETERTYCHLSVLKRRDAPAIGRLTKHKAPVV